MKMNIGKTKVMVSGKYCNDVKRLGKGPCTVFGKVFGSNSIRYTSGSGWVHKRCSGVKGYLVRVEDTFVCRTCERAGDEGDRNVEESLDLGNGVHL